MLVDNLPRAVRQSDNPLIDPDWRFRRAKKLAELGTRRFNRYEDSEIIAACKYCKARNRATFQSMPALRYNYPHIFRAHDIYENSPDSARMHIEAMVLAGLPTEEIASRFCEHERTIEVYEKLFFDLRCKAEARDWLLAVLSERMMRENSLVYRGDAVLKYIAVALGPAMLDQMISGLPLTEEVLEQWRQVLISNLMRDGVMISYARTPTRYNAHEIITELLMCGESQIKEKQMHLMAGAATTRTDDFMGSILKTIQFSLAAVRAKDQQSGVELAASVQALPQLTERLQADYQEASDANITE